MSAANLSPLKITSLITSCAFAFCFSFALTVGLPQTASAADLFEPEDKKTTRIKLGGAVGFKPEYEGSDEYELTGFPIIGFESMAQSVLSGRISVDGADAVKFSLLRGYGFEVGPLGGIRFDREEDEADILEGLGDVDTAFVLGAFAKYNFTPKYFAQVSYHQDVTDEDTGYEIKFGLGTKQTLSNGWKMKGYVGGVFSDEEYFDTYFGITPEQSLNSAANLAAFNPDDGIKSVEASLGFEIPLNEKWELQLRGEYAFLFDEASDSPLVENENQFTGSVGLAYYFDWVR